MKESIMRRTRRSEAGFSLQEILLTLAILGIIAIVAIPNFNGYMKVVKAQSAVNEMVGAINLGRQLAVTKREAHIFLAAPAPANTWQLRNVVTTEKLREGTLPPGMTNAAAVAFQFDANGACTNPTTYVGTTPSTQYIRLDADIQSGRVDQYLFEVGPNGRLKTSRTTVTP